MRQVPRQTGETVPHLLIGSGRVAKHFARYLSLAGISFRHWETPRQIDGALTDLVSRSERVWLLVSDSAIQSVALQIRAFNPDAVLFHASGATVVPGVRGVHPLMTFGPSLYDLTTYQRIPFVIEEFADGASGADILGGLPNPTAFIEPSQRSLYHALVSVSGNFPAILWADTFQRFEQDLGLPRELLVPFLFRTLLNVIERGESALTGPLIRGDRETIRRHHQALQGTPLASLYSAFETFIQTDAHSASAPAFSNAERENRL